MANSVGAIFSSGITGLKTMSFQKKLKLALLILAFLALTIGLSFGSRFLLTRIHIPVFNVAWIMYLIVFGLFLVVSLVPFGPKIMLPSESALVDWVDTSQVYWDETFY